jgi:hypothetical protein
MRNEKVAGLEKEKNFPRLTKLASCQNLIYSHTNFNSTLFLKREREQSGSDSAYSSQFMLK